MTWPTAATKVHMDAGTDDPKQARAELADLVDQFNTLRSHFAAFMQTFVGSADAATARSNLDVIQAINSLTAETSPATADLVGIYDDSATAYRKMTLANLLKVVNGLTELTSVDGANDFLLGYDASAGTAKKIKPDNLGGVFTESFASGANTITSAGSLSIAHGLSDVPALIQARLVCISAEHGYSTSDRLIAQNHDMASGPDGENTGHSLVVTNTTIDIRFGSAASVYQAINKTTGNAANLTNANWQLYLRAWR